VQLPQVLYSKANAASLIVFRFVVAAVPTNRSVFREAVSDLIILGVTVLSWILCSTFALFFGIEPKSSSTTMPITFVAPSLFYISAEQFE